MQVTKSKRRCVIAHLLFITLFIAMFFAVIYAYHLLSSSYKEIYNTRYNFTSTTSITLNVSYNLDLDYDIEVDKFIVTAYVPQAGGINCAGDCNTTAIGMKVSAARNTNVTYCAVDNSIIPFGSVIIIQGLDKPCVAVDTGGGIRGKHIDVMVDDLKTAYRIGRKQRLVIILKRR